MSHELLYTSAPQGLKPGSYGFCTVQATEGIPKVLQDRLESLSGYEHPFSLTDARAPLNPVNYSHLSVTVANQRLHLLSRIADAGADYSGRSNKIAYHLVLPTGEVTAASPAEVLAATGVCPTSFDGTARWLPPAAPPRIAPGPFRDCSAWASLCGDAGWAGVLAQRTLKDPAKPVTLIFAAGADVLPLVVEALSLLPPDMRWRTSFSTFFTKLPAGMDCQWRFVLDGTPAADQARRNLQLPPILLASPGPVLETGPLVDAARSGRAPAGMCVTIPNAAAATRSVVVAPTLPQRSVPADAGNAGTVNARPPTLAAGAPSVDDLFGKPSSAHQGWLYGAIGGAALLTLLVGVTAWALLSRPKPVPLVATTPVIDPRPEVVVENSDALKQLVAEQAAEKQRQSHPPAPEIVVAAVVAPPKEIPIEPPAPVEELPPVFKNIESKGKILSLPKLDRGLLEVSSSDPLPPLELCKIYVDHPADCQLKLITTEQFDGVARLRLIPDEVPAEGQQGWTAHAFTRTTATEDSQAVKLGRFVLQGHSLTFAWANDIPDWANPFGLEYCKLEVAVGDQKIACQLSQPKLIYEPVRLRLQIRGDKIPIEISDDSLTSFENVRFDLELRHGKFSKMVSQVKAGDSEAVKIRIPGDEPDGSSDVELEFRFLPPAKSNPAAFSCAAFIFPAYLTQVPNVPEWKRNVKRIDELEDLLRKYDGNLKPREGVVAADFDKLRKIPKKNDAEASKNINLATLKLNDMEERLKILAGEKPDSLTKQEEKELDTLPKQIASAESWIKHWNSWIDFSKTQNQWIGLMKKRLGELEKTVEVRYSVYLDFGDEQAVITRTEPAPGKLKTTPQPPEPNPPESESPEKDDKPKATTESVEN